MKIIQPVEKYKYDELAEGRRLASETTTYQAPKIGADGFVWTRPGASYLYEAIAFEFKGVECQVRVCDNADGNSRVIANIVGEAAYLHVYRESGFLHPHNRADLRFGPDELSFNRTEELPAELQKLAEFLLEALMEAARICDEVYQAYQITLKQTFAAQRTELLSNVEKLKIEK